MRSHLLRAATTLSVLVAGLPWATIATTAFAAPNPSLRVKVIQAGGAPAVQPSPVAAANSSEKDVADVEPTASESAVEQTHTQPAFTGSTEVYPVVSAPPASKTWELRPGTFLKAALQEWATEAGWSLVWAMPDRDDFRIDSGNRFSGDFKDAVVGLFDALPQHIQIFAELRPDNSPPLIYITREQGVR